LQALAAAFAIGAAVFWFLASIERSPASILQGIEITGGPQMFGGDQVGIIKAVIKQSRLNAWAAACAGVSALLQAALIFLSR
jgi:hypothetical protein